MVIAAKTAKQTLSAAFDCTTLLLYCIKQSMVVCCDKITLNIIRMFCFEFRNLDLIFTIQVQNADFLQS